MNDLTEAQRKCLLKASKPGGVVGFGQKYRVAGPLRRMGLLTPNTENFGYLVLTDSGREALSKSNSNTPERNDK